MYDVLSTSEQEVCLRGEIFLRAQPSSWSRNVYVDRLVHPNYSIKAANDHLLLDILYKDDIDRDLWNLHIYLLYLKPLFTDN